MYKSRFLIGFLVFVIVAILLAIGGFALYQLGYSQGYSTGLAMSSVEEGAALLPHQSIQHFGYYPYLGYGGFSRPLLLCFAGGAFLLVLFTILKSIRFLTWRSMMGAEPDKWHRYWRHHRHGPPGWYGDDDPKPQGSEPKADGNPESN